MDPKPRPNLDLQVAILRRLSPEQRLAKALELEELVREAHRAGLSRRNPGLADDEIRRLAAAEVLQWARRNS
jgi:Xaa-Pro aminopeptidase